MQTLNLLTEYIGDMDAAQGIINEFHWFLNVEEFAGQWKVTSGEKTLLTADSREAVDAFLYGMALAYKGLPPHLYAKLFSMIAGVPLDALTQEGSPVDLDLIDADDERLLDVTSPEFPNIEEDTPPADDSDNIF